MRNIIIAAVLGTVGGVVAVSIINRATLTNKKVERLFWGTTDA